MKNIKHPERGWRAQSGTATFSVNFRISSFFPSAWCRAPFRPGITCVCGGIGGRREPKEIKSGRQEQKRKGSTIEKTSSANYELLAESDEGKLKRINVPNIRTSSVRGIIIELRKFLRLVTLPNWSRLLPSHPHITKETNDDCSRKDDNISISPSSHLTLAKWSLPSHFVS